MQCRHCNRFYKSHQKLQEHVRKYCLKQKKYKCVSCEYRSRRKDHVLRHAKRKHCELYANSKEDEESLYEIRNEDESDEQMRFETESLGTGSGSAINVQNLRGANLMSTEPFNFDFVSRDLTITAVPILQESDEDDDDYDDDGE
ncbi:uncharacterized protein LOC119681833 [Teleopsis dalmanni]|uniref:uncharacterized protein LOC119681833 n=1 Tax=Teleopsis dalmanni TaxID=139649 RepID=UPI0018CD9EA2|nr:uncharacterized protein LOC119681833 [Teleopsis dalmanni]